MWGVSLDAEIFKKYIGYFVFVDYVSDERKVFFFGELVDVTGGKLHVVSVKDSKEAYIDVDEIINFKVKKVEDNE